MRVELLAPHIIDDVWQPTKTILEVSVVTPLMHGLDVEAQAAIAAIKLQIFGRWVGRWPNLRLLDDPPIERPLDDPQPVGPVGI